MLTQKQRALLLFINSHLSSDGISPSFEEMKEALGLKSKSGVHRLINALEERGFIRRLPNRARALEVLKLPESASNAMTGAAAARPKLVHDKESAQPAASSNVVRGNFGRRAEDRVGGNGAGKARKDSSQDAGLLDIPLHGRIAAGVPIEAVETSNMLTIPATMVGTGEHFALEVSGDSMIEAGIFDGDYAIIQRADTAANGDIVVALVDEEEATLKTLRKKDGLIRLEPSNAQYPVQIYKSGQVRVQGRLVALLRRY